MGGKEPSRRDRRLIPYWIIELELLPEVKTFRADPGKAVFHCAVTLEELIRSKSGAPPELVGQNLINEVMRSGKLLEPKAPVQAERDAWTNLYRGVYGAMKNPESSPRPKSSASHS